MTNTKFTTKNPNYFKQYYKNNKNKFNTHTKTQWYGIQLFGTVYYFDMKKHIPIKIYDIEDINQSNFIHVPNE